MNGTAGGRERERESEEEFAVLVATRRKSGTIAPMKMPGRKKSRVFFVLNNFQRKRDKGKEGEERERERRKGRNKSRMETCCKE